MSLPFRAQAPAFAGTGSYGPWGPRAAGAGSNPLLKGWKPAARAAAAGALRGGGPINWRFIGAGTGGLIAGLLADYAINATNAYLALWLNGLTHERTCSVGAMVTWFSSTSMTNCLSATGPGNNLRSMPAAVAAASPTTKFRFLMPYNLVFSRETDGYGVVPVAGGVRPRPFYAPFPLVGVAAHPVAGVDAIARPGTVPYGRRPWPVWAGARPVGAVGGNAIPDSPDRAWYPPVPGTGWTINPGTGVRPMNPTAPIARAVPRPGVRETKVGANTPAFQMFVALMKAKEAVSEVEDFVVTMFKALPKPTQSRYDGNNMGSMVLALIENWDDMDFRLWFRNLLQNHLEDEIIGRVWFGLRGKARDAFFGDSIGSLGEVGTADFKAFAKAVSKETDAWVNEWFGYTGKARHWQDQQRIDDAGKSRAERDRKQKISDSLRNRL